MSKGVTPLIAVILVLLVVITVTGLGVLFITTSTQSAQNFIQKQQEHQAGGIPRINEINYSTIYVYSAGKTDLKNPAFYINGQQIDATGPTDLTPGQIGTYVLDPVQIRNFPIVAEVKVSAGDSVDMMIATIRKAFMTIVPMSSILTNQVVYAAAGSIIFRDSSNLTDLMTILDNGNVGIGTASDPTQKLEVNGNVKASQYCLGASCISSWPTGSWQTSGSNIYYTGGGVGIGKITAAPFEIYNNSNGYIGDFVFSGSILSMNELNTSKSTFPYIEWRNSTGARGAFMGWGNSATNRYFQLATENGNSLYISGGSVGINISTPAATLHVSNSDTTGNTDVGRFGGYGDFLVDAPAIVGGRFIVQNGGNVGIGTASPTQKLDVNGNIKATAFYGSAGGYGGSIKTRSASANGISFDWSAGALSIWVDATPIFSATPGKTFIIQHPMDENKYLVHATLEGPENAVFYRGEAQLVNGVATIKLPDYFEALTHEEGRTVLLTPKFSDINEKVSALAASSVINGTFAVKSIDNNNPNQKFDWEVKAVRKDTVNLTVEPYKDQIEVRGFGPYTYYVPKK